MEIIIWLVIMIPTSALFTGLGIFAWRRKKPMWFYSGSTVSEKEIADIPGYNRANGIMWLVFSAVFWLRRRIARINMFVLGLVADKLLLVAVFRVLVALDGGLVVGRGLGTFAFLETAREHLLVAGLGMGMLLHAAHQFPARHRNCGHHERNAHDDGHQTRKWC